MLNEAEIFTDFLFTFQASGSQAFVASPRNSTAVKIKDGNSAYTTIDIYAPNLPLTMDKYKYFSRDKKNIYEIANYISNGDTYTVDLAYLGELEFDEVNTDRFIAGMSAQTLQRMHLDLNSFFSIIGSSAQINNTRVYRKSYTNADRRPIIYGVKIGYSEYPQNLNRSFSSTGWVTSGISTPKTLTECISRIYNPASVENNPPHTSGAITTDMFNTLSDKNYVIVPFPHGLNRLASTELRIYKGSTLSSKITYDITSFLKCVKSLISELTTSIEITLLSATSLVFRDSTSTTSTIYMNLTTNANSISLYASPSTGAVEFGDMIRGLPDNDTPIFVIKNSIGNSTSGIYEIYNFIRLENIQELMLSGNEFVTDLVILNQRVSLAGCESMVYAKRLEGGLRIFRNVYSQDYTDIPTQLDFTQTAFSNYEAYTKANLVQAQKLSAAEYVQTEKQSWIKNMLSMIGGDLSFGARMGGSAAIGGAEALTSWVPSAISHGVGNFVNAIGDTVNTFFQRANKRLQYSNELSRAQTMIVPSQDISGAIAFSDITKALNFINQNPPNSSYVLYSLIIVSASDYHIRMLKNEIVKNGVVALQDMSVTDNRMMPIWYTEDTAQFLIKTSDLTSNKGTMLLWGSNGFN